MAGAGVRITVDVEDESLRSALRRLTARVDDLKPVMDEIGSSLVASTIDRFERETDPDGKPWKPSRRAQREGGQTLTDKGRLRASITHRADRDGVDVGTNVVYAAIHQFGGTVKRQARRQTLAFNKKGGGFASRKSTRRRRAGFVAIAFAEIGAHEVDMPARPFLGVNEADRVSILNIVSRAIERAAS